MTPAARVQAAIDILDQVSAAARAEGPAADTLIARYFAARRYAGSKDRRAVRDWVYAAIRAIGDVPASGRAAMLRLARDDVALAALFDGSTHGPAPITPDEPVAEAGLAPGWLVERLAAAGIEATALLDRAPLDVRVNALKADPDEVARSIPDAAPIAGVPGALRLPSGTRIDSLAAWRAGAIEVQDAGSQIVAMAAGVAPGMHVIDLCAGAGGKTLAMAAAMANRGALLACDTDRARLSKLAPRARRAGATIVETRLIDPARELEMLHDERDRADLVLIDAPCSGTGTWRRNPEARWRLTPERLDRLAKTQARLLDIGAALVRPGGALVYITCSLLDAEGGEQIDAFVERHTDWTVEAPDLPAGSAHRDGVRLTPALDATDGFFVARLRRPC